MGRILYLGFSPVSYSATDSIILIAMNTVPFKIRRTLRGDMLITCATIVQSYMLLITSPMIGISGGTQAIISFNYGAADTKRVRQTEKCVLLLCLYHCDVLCHAAAAGRFHPSVHHKSGNLPAFHMGNRRLYDDDHPLKLPVHPGGRADRHGTDQNCAVPVHFPENPLYPPGFPAPADYQRSFQRIFRGTHCGSNLFGPVHNPVPLNLQKIICSGVKKQVELLHAMHQKGCAS